MGGMFGRSYGPLVTVSSWREESTDTWTVGAGGAPSQLPASDRLRSQLRKIMHYSSSWVQKPIARPESGRQLLSFENRGREPLIIPRPNPNVKHASAARGRFNHAAESYCGLRA